MREDILSVLVSEEQLRQRVAELGAQITRDYEGKNLVLVSVLKGSVTFMADLMRAIDLPLRIDFMSVSSYGAGTKTSGVVKIVKDLDKPVVGKHVVLVEDIVDTGRTLSLLVERLKQRNPLSLEVVTLLDKPDRRVVDFKADKSLFVIPDLFVIGYGLDYGEYYRNLPYIAEFEGE